MKWFRSNIKHGSRLALFALAVQFALSFGHFHGAAAQAGFSAETGAAQAGAFYAKGLPAPSSAAEIQQQSSPPNHDSDRQAGDACAICAVIAMANATWLATPPLLLLPQAIAFLYLATDAGFVHLNSARVAFQPRAPPAS